MAKILQIYFLVGVLLFNSVSFAAGGDTSGGGYEFPSISLQIQGNPQLNPTSYSVQGSNSPQSSSSLENLNAAAVTPSGKVSSNSNLRFHDFSPTISLPLAVNLYDSEISPLDAKNAISIALSLPEFEYLADYKSRIESLILEIDYRGSTQANTHSDLIHINFDKYDFLFSSSLANIIQADKRYEQFIRSMQAGDLHLSLAEIYGALYLFLVKEWMVVSNLILHQEISKNPNQESIILKGFADRTKHAMGLFQANLPQYVKHKVENLFANGKSPALKSFLESMGTNFEEIKKYQEALQRLVVFSQVTKERGMRKILESEKEDLSSVKSTLSLELQNRLTEPLSFSNISWVLGLPVFLVTVPALLSKYGLNHFLLEVPFVLSYFFYIIIILLDLNQAHTANTGPGTKFFPLLLREFISPFLFFKKKKRSKELVSKVFDSFFQNKLAGFLKSQSTPVVLTQENISSRKPQLVIQSRFADLCSSFFQKSSGTLALEHRPEF